MRKIFSIFVLCGLLVCNSFSKAAESRFIFQEGHNEDISSTSFSGDGKWFASADSSCIKVWEVSSGRLLKTIKAKSIWNCSLSYDGSFLVYVHFIDYSHVDVVLYDIENESSEILETMQMYETVAAFSPSGKYLIVNDRVYDFNSKSVIKRLSKYADIDSFSAKEIKWSPDESKVLVSSARRISEYSVLTGKILNTLATSDYSGSPIAYSASGDFIAYSDDSKIKVLDCASFVEVASFSYKYFYSNYKVLSFNSNDNVNFYPSGTYDFWSGEKVYDYSGACSYDGSAAAIFGKSGTVSFFDTSTMKAKNSLANKFDNIVYSDYSASTNSLLLASEEGRILQFNLNELQLENLTSGKNSREKYIFQRIVAYSKSGNYILYRDNNNNICLFDVKQKKQKYVFSNTAGFVKTVAFSQDDAYVYAASGKELNIWSVASGNLINKIPYQGKSNYGSVTYIEKYGIILNLTDEYFHGKLEVLDENGKFVKYISVRQVDNYVYNESDNSLNVLFDSGIGFYDIPSLNCTGKINVAVPRGQSISACMKEKFVGVSSYGNFFTYDKKELSKVHSFEMETISYSDMDLFFTGDGKCAITVTGKGFKIWALDSEELLATAIIAKDDDWLIYTPEGYFSGTSWAIKNLVHISKGRSIIDVENESGLLNRKDLIISKIHGEKVERPRLEK